MKKAVFILTIYFAILNGCSTLPKPSNTSNTLIIGRVINNTSEKGNIKIQLLEEQSGERKTCTVKKGGLFFFGNVDENNYIIEDVRIVQKGNEIIFTGENIEFEIIKNAVNNIGVIFLEGKNSIRNADRHIVARYEFMKEHGKSPWLEKEWINYIWNYIKIENEITIPEDELRLLMTMVSENKDIEFQIYGKDELDYTQIDEIEKIDIPEEELLQFMKEGHLVK
jgi:hypothetical protein